MAYTRQTIPATTSGAEGAVLTARQLGNLDRAIFDNDARLTSVEGCAAAGERGLLAQNFPAELCSATGIIMPSAGQVRLIRLRLPADCKVTNILMATTVAGGTLTAGQCFAALYTSAGVKVGVTADMKATWEAAAGLKTMALASGPFAMVAGDCYVALWYNGTTAPTWVGMANTGISALANLGKAAPNLLWATADTGITTTAPDPLGAQTASSIVWWVGLSVIAAVAPSTNPTAGGVLYVEAGALKYRGSSGTVTTLGNA